MRLMMKALILAICMLFAVTSVSSSDEKEFGFFYAPEQHKGGNVTPTEAHQMLKKDPDHVKIVDIRTRSEYRRVGHAPMAYNIPVKFFTNKLGKTYRGFGYVEKINGNFGKDVLARFNPKTDTILFMCSAGGRGNLACNKAAEAGYPEDKLYNVLGGFEGGEIKYKDSAYYGQARLGGWRNEGLPWTYEMNPDLVYLADK